LRTATDRRSRSGSFNRAFSACNHEADTAGRIVLGTVADHSEFVTGRQDIIAFLTRKWMKELDYRLIVLIETGNAGRLDKACLGVLSPGGA
jgi:hypothetical protein